MSTHRPIVFRAQFWLVVGSLLSAAGGWLYVQRVLIPHQVRYATAHDRPRGNLSDLYPRWVGARELLIHGRDPYTTEVAREIQTGYYGRPLDLARPDDPRDLAGFAYPVYVIFLLAPTIQLPFAVVQVGFFWLLVVLTCGSALLWIRILGWPLPTWAQISLVALTLGSLGVVQGLLLQQMSLLVAGLVAIAIALLVADYAVAAGVLLAVATIKPQLVALLLVWLVAWVAADWRRRYRLAVSFLATMAVLLGAAEWYLPHWIPRFWQAVREYQQYTGARSVLDNLIGAPWSWGLEVLALAAMFGACYKERRQEANGEPFAFMTSLVLATTVLLVPISAPYNQVLLIPAILLLFRERRTIWGMGVAMRVVFSITATLLLWPWISSSILAGLSFVLPWETIDRAWAIPSWTVIQTPVAVAALMLVFYYQRYYQGSFTAPPGRGSS